MGNDDDALRIAEIQRHLDAGLRVSVVTEDDQSASNLQRSRAGDHRVNLVGVASLKEERIDSRIARQRPRGAVGYADVLPRRGTAGDVADAFRREVERPESAAGFVGHECLVVGCVAAAGGGARADEPGHDAQGCCAFRSIPTDERRRGVDEEIADAGSRRIAQTVAANYADGAVRACQLGRVELAVFGAGVNRDEIASCCWGRVDGDVARHRINGVCPIISFCKE